MLDTNKGTQICVGGFREKDEEQMSSELLKDDSLAIKWMRPERNGNFFRAKLHLSIDLGFIFNNFV